jgi:hypothetical protein
VTVTVELPTTGIAVVSEKVRVRLTVWITTEVWPVSTELDPAEDPGVTTPELTKIAPAVMPRIITARAIPMTFEDGNISEEGLSDLIMSSATLFHMDLAKAMRSLSLL